MGAIQREGGSREGRRKRGRRERLERAAQPRSAPRSPSIVAAALLDDVDRDVVALDAVDGLLGVVHAKLVLGENEDCRAARTVSSRLFALWESPRRLRGTHSTGPGRRCSTS